MMTRFVIQPFQLSRDSLRPPDLSLCRFWPIEDVQWMHHALELAQRGAALGEVPVGAVLVHNQQVIGQGFNQPISRHDATAHAEVIAIREACAAFNNYRLPAGTTLYVTLEPCTMCVGALIHARVARLVFAASEPRAGMVGSQLNLPAQDFYNHTLEVDQGLCSAHSSQLLKAFFRERRKSAKKIQQAKQLLIKQHRDEI
ncbi:tRNA adenosine(34) deaminase TadA [Psychrobacter coccoides]|nr:tRNA adenosine(34) deaminase TadA [Psychrobacter coccoides]